MREKSVMSRRFMAQNEVFADIFNYYLYQGEQIIKASDLEERDSTQVAVLINDEHMNAVEKIRDILKDCVIKTTQKAIYLVMGIENQSEIHYAMPVRKFLYDALNYTKQVEEISKKNIKEKKYKNSAEFLSGFLKHDKIKPVITLVVYWGAEPWDAPRSLYEMLDVDDPEILRFIDDYRLKVIVPNEITDFAKFHSDARYVLEFISASENQGRLREIMGNPAYEQLDNETIKMINCFTGANIKINKKKGVSNVCLAIQQMLDEERQKGKQECAAIKQELVEEKKKNKENKQQCLAIQQMLDEEKQKRISLLKKLLDQGKITLADVTEEMEMSVAEVEKIFT